MVIKFPGGAAIRDGRTWLGKTSERAFYLTNFPSFYLLWAMQSVLVLGCDLRVSGKSSVRQCIKGLRYAGEFVKKFEVGRGDI